MVRSHSSPLHGLRTSRYRGGRAVCLLSGRLGISPNFRSPVVKLLCHASPVFQRFRVNGSHASHHDRSLSRSHNCTLPYYLPSFLVSFNKLVFLVFSCPLLPPLIGGIADPQQHPMIPLT